LILSFGGDNGAFLGSAGVLKAFFENDISFETIRCTGISCIPVVLSSITKSPNRAYVMITHIWSRVRKLYMHFFENGPSFPNMVEILRIIAKAGVKKMEGLSNRKRLDSFVDEIFPNIHVPKGLEILAFDVIDGKEVTFKEGDNLRYALKASLSFPLIYEPFDEKYVSSSWITGIPEGDLVILISPAQIEEKNPRLAVEYMFLATIARKKELERRRLEKAEKVLRINVDVLSPSYVVRRCYLKAKEFIEEVLV